jgi:hypothetical protein
MTEFVTLFRQFLYRDLAFILGGFIVFGSLAYAFRGSVDWPTLWQKFPPGSGVLGTILIAAAAYVIGYAVQDVGGVLHVTSTSWFEPGPFRRLLYRCFTRFCWKDVRYPNDREFTFEICLGRLDIHEPIIQSLERIRSLKVISMCVGGCLAVSAVIFLVQLVCDRSSVAIDVVIFVLSAFFAFCLICLGWIKGMQEMQFYQSIHEEGFPLRGTVAR